jgi:hypothetical protein
MAAEVEVLAALAVLPVWVVLGVEVLLVTPALLALLTLAVVAEAVQAHHQTQVQAVQALSFFATPAQFNISLVAQ